MTLTEKNIYQANLFSNRLLKNYKQLKKWARKNKISCYRLYDRDIPEIPLAVDLYTFLPDEIKTKLEVSNFLDEQNVQISANTKIGLEMQKDELKRTYLHIYLYERPYEKDQKDEEDWLLEMKKAAASSLNIDEKHIIIKTRRKQSGNEESARNQYTKIETDEHLTGFVQEQGQIFKVNLTDYIDTGLFFDHRPLRAEIRKSCDGKKVLNLFCYTGSFSVYAAQGNAKEVQSVDLSKTYLDWAKENMKMNEFTNEKKYFFTRDDVFNFLNRVNAENQKNQNAKSENFFDIIILDPPTFSNSKRTENTLDINKDWPVLIAKCLKILKANGILYFSTNSRKLNFKTELLSETVNLNNLQIEDITLKTIPEDFRNSKIHRAWKITKVSY